LKDDYVFSSKVRHRFLPKKRDLTTKEIENKELEEYVKVDSLVKEAEILGEFTVISSGKLSIEEDHFK